MEAPRKKSAKRVKSTPSPSRALTNLPKPILMEILCRVPIKTLTASKIVCKSWLNLIRDPKFRHLHRSRAPTEVCIQPCHYVEGDPRTLHLGNLDSPNNLPPCPFEFPESCVRHYQGPNGKLYFANSCNGLLCYYGGSHTNRFALVCNPFTGEYITFPPPEVHEKFSGCRGYALGFSSKANKFKLLRFMRTTGLKMQICTIEKGCSWKAVGRCELTKFSKDLGAVFLQGALHWVPDGIPISWSSILVFNMENDRLGSFESPTYLFLCDATGRSRNILGVLAGYLSLTVHNADGGVTIWSMMEYGEEDSWVKLFSVGSTICKGLEMKYVRCIPIVCVGNSEILMKCIHDTSSTVIVYNPIQRTGRVIGSGPVLLRVIAYNPSLVLLRDSVLGYHVYVKPNCAGLKQGQIFTIPKWWSPMEDEWRPLKESAQHGCKAPVMDDELSDARVGEEGEGYVSAKTESSASGDVSESATSESSPPDEPLDSASSKSSDSNESSDSATSGSPASEDPTTCTRDKVRGISEERRFRLINKMSLDKAKLMWEMEKLKHRREMEELKYRGKELKHRREMEVLKQHDKVLGHQGKVFDQRDKLLNILQELDNTDQSQMTAREMTRHQSKIKRYENLIARTFNQ